MKNLNIDRDELLRVFDYNKETGELIYRVSRGTMKAGKVAGGRDKDGYVCLTFNGNYYQAHRLIWFYMTGEWPEFIDHINHDKADNRWSNIRNVTKKDNQQNAGMRTDNKSGITGIAWVKRTQSWQATITDGYGKKVYLGSGNDLFELACRRKSAENKYGYHENHGR